MADVSYRPRGSRPPEDLRRRLAALLDELGPRQLAARLGLARDTVLGVAAGCRGLPGTAALLRERLPMLERSSAEGPSAEEIAQERSMMEMDERQGGWRSP